MEIFIPIFRAYYMCMHRNFLHRRFTAWLLVLLFASSTLYGPSTYSNDSKSVKAESCPRPVLREGPIALPNTNIKVGTYSYVYSDGSIGRKIGFLINEKDLFLVEYAQYDIGGDVNYGIYKNYLVIDGWSYGAGHNRMMFLFKYNKDSVQLLDVIGKAYLKKTSLDFLSEYDKSAPCDIYRCPPRPMIIRDADQDGNPEIRLLIVNGKRYELYLEIMNERLQISLRPDFYKPYFDRAKQKPYEGIIRSFDYYLYGFLAKQLSLEEIKGELMTDKSRQYEWLLFLLENYRTWDTAFHKIREGEPELVKYKPQLGGK